MGNELKPGQLYLAPSGKYVFVEAIEDDWVRYMILEQRERSALAPIRTFLIHSKLVSG